MRKRAPDNVLVNRNKLSVALNDWFAKHWVVFGSRYPEAKRELIELVMTSSAQPHSDRFLLEDVFGVKPEAYLLGKLDVSTFGILVSLFGYSDCNTVGGGPVLVENRHGIPYAVIWADVNREDPTHTISLEGAKESNRKEP
jgi:hypothetical protein